MLPQKIEMLGLTKEVRFIRREGIDHVGELRPILFNERQILIERRKLYGRKSLRKACLDEILLVRIQIDTTETVEPLLYGLKLFLTKLC